MSSPSNSQCRPSPANQVFRSRLGCWTCREKKVKCDEQRPRCRRCIRLGRSCDYTQRPRKKYTRRSQGKGAEIHDDPDTGPLSLPSGSPDDGSLRAVIIHADHQGETQHRSGMPTLLDDSSPTQTDYLRFLSASDHEAIDYFRSVLSTLVDTKLPEHSGPAMVWTLAQRNPMLLHMVCTLGAQNLSYQTTLAQDQVRFRRAQAMQHYGDALQLLSAATHNIHAVHMSDFDCILATLWLMIVYEQKYGDGRGVGLIAHFQGAALLLKDHLRNICGTLTDLDATHNLNSTLSPISSRMVIWISLTDGGATFNEIRSGFNHLLGEALQHGSHVNVVIMRLRLIVALHKHSNLAYREIWGDSYPQTQLLEDLASEHLFYLQSEAGQLRYVISQHVEGDHTDLEAQTYSTHHIIQAIQDLERRYSGYIEAATLLDLPEEGSQRRFVMNIRTAVAWYYAVLLYFHAFCPSDNSTQRQRALGETMKLCGKAFQDHKERAMLQMAWPLYVAALETDDIIHQNWILDRYDALQNYGENYRRAYEALRLVLSQPRRTPIDRYEFLQRGGGNENFTI
ncbi:fungal-specific transcription factor domain-containing protein [Talaromyces proteolyticus]|uniref:Fungal-specific transcription factor domain-containing protein n=1 Tax=Talaromyces proteolyticus TaxID=1131652 RepID=A0AAD4KY35_9EURO|nr:fungal-specific transcription factor domain-containing protein [Talaromyces proteolyticus]KAH8703027.1 fungal-specific transcription factor domain-containing protein [Talaromyces proteolyticus]